LTLLPSLSPSFPFIYFSKGKEIKKEGSMGCVEKGMSLVINIDNGRLIVIPVERPIGSLGDPLDRPGFDGSLPSLII
jgi:hypothetical protein